MYFKTRNNALSQLCHGETQGIWLNNITFRDLVIWAPVNNSLGLVITYCRKAKSFTKVKCFALEPPPVALRSTFFYYYLPSLCKPHIVKKNKVLTGKTILNYVTCQKYMYMYTDFQVLSFFPEVIVILILLPCTECVSICWLKNYEKIRW